MIMAVATQSSNLTTHPVIFFTATTPIMTAKIQKAYKAKSECILLFIISLCFYHSLSKSKCGTRASFTGLSRATLCFKMISTVSAYSAGFMFVYTFCTSSNSSSFSTILSMVARSSPERSLRSLGMYVNSPPISSNPFSSRNF